jgi:hypothetical protein
VPRGDASTEDVLFGGPFAIGETGEVALEDYARVLARAEDAVALRRPEDPGMIHGLRVTGPRAPLTDALRADLEAFARDLAHAEGGGGLGWS